MLGNGHLFSSRSLSSKIESVVIMETCNIEYILLTLHQTNIQTNLYFRYGIAPPQIRREVSSELEKTKREDNRFHPGSNHEPAQKRKIVLCTLLKPIITPANYRRMAMRVDQSLEISAEQASFGPSESLPSGSNKAWPTWCRAWCRAWSCLNRLWTGTARRMHNPHACMGYTVEIEECETADEKMMKHLFIFWSAPLLSEPCTPMVSWPRPNPASCTGSGM